ncbi:putative nuclease HARBI1 [Ixodes scapularis]|uniref:putative nuclease HARBI1 n=1 Tax=Ixodes scapularis TaxID=6945 RepID=UPI001C38C264|nr:putative nuclease HARBI1 [Ixodes scapularis]
MSEARFVREYRLTKDVARWLCNELRRKLQRRRVGPHVLTVELQVLVALRFYAAGGFQGTVASDENIAIHQCSVSRVLVDVTEAIIDCLGPAWVKFPQTDQEKAAAKRKFYLLCGFSGVIGCVDGIQIAIRAPSENDERFSKAAYWCRKNYYALNAMVVCDADLRITSFDGTFPGSVHDSFVWRASLLREEFVAGKLIQADECLLGDSGYPLEPWLLTPVAGNPAGAEAAFNRKHRSTRSIVERCIGMLKNKFRCLQGYRALHYDPERACNIATACVVLHNVCIYCTIPEPVPEPLVSDESDSEDCEGSDSSDCEPQARTLRERGQAMRRRKDCNICVLWCTVDKGKCGHL